MLVYEMFPGDDTELAWAQHDVYGSALATIRDRSRRHFLNACLIAGGEAKRWPSDLSIDHRVLQDAHDILAGAWRWHFSPPQSILPLNDRHLPTTAMSSWLRWLNDEVSAWWHEPDLVLSTVAAITHQNDAIGYAGELRLRNALFLRHMAVPWRESLLTR